MREPRRKLLHLALRFGILGLDQHFKVGPDHAIAVEIRRLVVAACCRVLSDLPEDPWIRWSRPPDHYSVAAGLGNQRTGVFRAAHIAVADDGNLHRVIYRSDPPPARLARIALLARPRMQRHSVQSGLLRKPR